MGVETKIRMVEIRFWRVGTSIAMAMAMAMGQKGAEIWAKSSDSQSAHG